MKKAKKRLNKKMKIILIVEAVLFLILFIFAFFCQLLVAKNTVLGSLKFSSMIMIPLLVYAVPVGFSYLIRGQLFVGDYESPLKADDKKGEVGDGDRNYAVANLLR